MSIKDNIKELQLFLEQYHCKLIAVTKTHPPDLIMQAYEADFKVYGENKVQELIQKQEALPPDIEWHLIGHLQRNKVKYVVPFVYLIQSVDSLRLLKEINKQGKKINRVINCLLQVHIAEEESKFGFSEPELLEALHSDTINQFEFVKIEGLMGMATFTEDEDQIRKEFRWLRNLFDNIKSTQAQDHPRIEMRELSMGMSSDYKIAVEEGSTMVRVGSAIFGQRNYQ
ncbi:MAG: YggS family pyridoxal phosphate-dependent enzyme [Candidatus Cyclobacteriaceae bacterium M3_2C_046]